MTPTVPHVGQQVEIEFPQGWRSGYTVLGITAALDRPYRVNVLAPDGTELRECAPECVRPTLF